MKKKYMPAELEIVEFSTCDVITTSIVEPPQEPGGSGTGGGSTTSGTTGIGSTYDDDAWSSW